jgi:hypothetical protein
MENAYTIVVRNPERKRPLGRYRGRWKDNNKVDLERTACGLDSSGSGQTRGGLLRTW